MRFPSLAAVAATLCVGLSAQSPLVTSLADNNSGGLGTTVFFDVTATNGLEINAFDCNLTNALGSPCSINVWVRGGTYVGNQLNPTGWTMVATDTGGIVAAGRGAGTNFPLTSTICVPAGVTLAIAIESDSSSGHAYITGTGANQNYSNADLTLDAGSVGTSPVFGGGLNDPRVFSGAVYYNLNASCAAGPFPAAMVAVGEASPGAGTLTGLASQPFEDGWNVRWNLTDPSGTNAGKISAVVLNYGIGGSAPIGVTAGIPGFDQLWGGSTPGGFAEVVGPGFIGSPDASGTVPAGVFSPGDTVRFQGLVLDPSVRGPFPVVPTTNTIELVHRSPVTIEVRCDGSNAFNSNTAFGFFSITNNGALDITNVEFDWVNSSVVNTQEFDTDQTGMADNFEGGNSTTAGCLGTYRNGSDVATGLVYGPGNTVNATPCDPASQTGWVGTNPGNATDDWRTLNFSFTNFGTGKKFEFDCDTDNGGSAGDDMAGMVVTITLSDNSVLTGEIQAAGTDLGVLNF